MGAETRSAETTSAEEAETRRRRLSSRILRWLDTFFFVFAGIASFWFAWLLLVDTWRIGWWGVAVFILFWCTLAYFALPRLHRILTAIYVPDYFIGRTRTSDGLLGDPINLAWLGAEPQIHGAMAAAGWTRADDLSLRSGMRIVTSTLTRRSYPEAPVSPLMLFERQQDFAYQQEVAGNPAQRHHVRFWKCPDGWLLPGGHRVDWLAAGTYDRAVGLSWFTLQVTHKIDEDTDVERDHIVASVLHSGVGATGYLLKDFSTGYHARNGGGDSIRTDGDLPVIDVRSAPSPSPSPAVASPAAHAAVEPLTPHARRPFLRTRKRAAYEAPLGTDPAEASVAEEVRRHGRPASITVGAALVVLRALVTVALWLTLVTSDIGHASPVAVIGGAVLIALEVTLAVLLLRGVNFARVALMALSALWSIATFVDLHLEGAMRTNVGEMAGVGLSILVLLALSSSEARHFSRRQRPRGTPRRRGRDAGSDADSDH